MEKIITGEEEMVAFGKQLAGSFTGGEVIALAGDLGAGKTHLVKGIAAGLGYSGSVTSPTFSLVHEYSGSEHEIYHLDFYRIESATELENLGWDELLEQGGIVIAEWADKFSELLPPDTLWIFLSHLDNSKQRKIIIRSRGEYGSVS